MRKTKVLFGVVVMLSDFALSVGCNEFALGVVMLILFYKIKCEMREDACEKGEWKERVMRASVRCVSG